MLTINFNAAELTVRDIYQLAIYDGRFAKPTECILADPHLAYCQLSGTYRMVLPGYNTVLPYDWMNEMCPNPFIVEGRPHGC